MLHYAAVEKQVLAGESMQWQQQVKVPLLPLPAPEAWAKRGLH